MVRIKVLYFGPVRELLGSTEETVDLGGAAPTIETLSRELVRRHPSLEARLGFIRFARNESMAEPSEALAQGDVVALIPPVAGGSGAAPAHRLRIATVTISDTRTEADDAGGAELRRLLEAAGFELAPHSIVPDGIESVQTAIRDRCRDASVHTVITTGGTGIAPRDQTYEAIDGLLEKRLDGFGEAFRRLSWEQVGARSILSRALAGVYAGKIVVALPGSPRALALAVEQVLAPVLPHAVALAVGRSDHR